MPRAPRRASPPHRAPAGRRRSGVEIVALSMLALLPIAFYRGTIEAFELPKASILVTGMAVLLAIALAREFARIGSAGMGGWLSALPPRLASGLRRDPLGAAVALFLVSATASTLASIRPELSFWGAPSSHAGLRTALATAAVFFASRSLASDGSWLRRVAVVGCLAALVAMAYALLQLSGLDPLGWVWTATFNDLTRVPGTLGHANHLGTYLAMSLPLMFWLSQGARSRAIRAAWIAAASVGLTVLAVTLSRGAWVALLAGGAVYAGLAVLSPRRKSAEASVDRGVNRMAGAGSVLAGILIALALFTLPVFTRLGPSLIQRGRQIADVNAPSTQSRFHLWRAGLRMAADRPALGIGTDAYLAAFPHYRTLEYWSVEWNGTSAKAHNELIQIAATQGGFGLLAALLVVGFTISAGVRAWRKAGEMRSGVAAAAAALTAFGVSSLVGFTVVATGALAAALAGWLAGQARSLDPAPPAVRAPRPTPRSFALAILLAFAVWVPLVAFPFRAAMIAAPGFRAMPGTLERAEAFEGASRAAPWDAYYPSELGRTLLTQGFAEADTGRAWLLFARAGAAFERAAKLAPEDAEFRALVARVAATEAALRPSEEAYERVAREFARTLAADSISASILEVIAQGYLQLGMDHEGRAVALRCAKLYPDYALPMGDLGMLALSEGRLADGIDTLTLAASRNWRGERMAEATARSNLAAAYFETGRYKEAWSEASLALDLDPTSRYAADIRMRAALAFRPRVP